MTPPTDPRPMTAAEARAIEALVEWRRLDAEWDAAWDAGVQESTAAVEQAENTMRDAADAVVAEREVQRGA